jgi:predicted kinase
MLDGEPTPFDALEFDDALATGDVYYDLAFLLMDLDHRRLRDSANRLLNRYIVVTGDIDGISALSMFMAVRACIRAKVALIAARDSESNQNLENAKSYFDLALEYLEPATPCLIGIGGLSGTGKSKLAASLSPDLSPAPGAVLFRSDVARKQLAHVSETTRLGPAFYTPEYSKQVYDWLLEKTREALACGASVVVDAVFAKPSERAALEGIARLQKVPFIGIWLDAPLALRTARVSARVGDASDADSTVANMQAAYEIGAMNWRICDASGSCADTLKHARTILADIAASKHT